jgi:hypothetical protein
MRIVGEGNHNPSPTFRQHESGRRYHSSETTARSCRFNGNAMQMTMHRHVLLALLLIVTMHCIARNAQWYKIRHHDPMGPGIRGILRLSALK